MNMSREFGSCERGYFYRQIENAASDLLDGREELTKKWGKFFHEFIDISYAISGCEAIDNGPDYPIFETIKHIKNLKVILDEIEKYCSVYQAVAENAVREYIEKIKGNNGVR
jgi:hypothetical protein